MIAQPLNTLVIEVDGVQYIPLAACQDVNRALRRENAELKAQLATEKRVNGELASQVQEAQELRWGSKLEKVNTKYSPTPEKQVIAAVRSFQQELPITEQGDTPVSRKMIAQRAGMSLRSVDKYLSSTVERGLILQRYDDSGQQMFLKLADDVYRSPYAIEKRTPVERKPAPRKVREPEPEPECFNCGSPRTVGFRHTSYTCRDCGWSDDVRELFPADGIVEPPRDAVSQSTIPPVVENVVPPYPDMLCAKCDRPRRECWVWLMDEQDGIGWWDLGCLLEKMSA